MSNEIEIAKSVQWQQRPLKDGQIDITCPECNESYIVSTEEIVSEDAPNIKGVTKTEEVITRHGNSRLLSIALGVIAYYLTHRAMFGPDASLGQGILVPVFVAVLVFSVSEAVWAGIYAKFSPKLAVYEVVCRGCHELFYMATNGKILAIGQEKTKEPEAQSA